MGIPIDSINKRGMPRWVSRSTGGLSLVQHARGNLIIDLDMVWYLVNPMNLELKILVSMIQYLSPADVSS